MGWLTFWGKKKKPVVKSIQELDVVQSTQLVSCTDSADFGGLGKEVQRTIEIDEENIEKPSIIFKDIRRVFAFPIKLKDHGKVQN